MQKTQGRRYRVAIVGASRRRQGTGAFLARHFARLGHPPCAVLGRHEGRTQAAAKDLARQFDAPVSAYTEAGQLRAKEAIDILVIASPAQTHLHYLREAVYGPYHVFCEKPLWWPQETESISSRGLQEKTWALIKKFAACNKRLYLNQQWPFTLDAFWRLYPSLGKGSEAIKEFSMQLSPLSRGKTMLVDASPHLLSMLHALLGDGTIEQLHCLRKNNEQCHLSFVYRHAKAQTRVHLRLQRRSKQPRPAAYAINGRWARRCVRLSDYSLSLSNDEQTVQMPDPLLQSVDYFLSTLPKKDKRGAPNNSDALLRSMQHLYQLLSS